MGKGNKIYAYFIKGKDGKMEQGITKDFNVYLEKTKGVKGAVGKSFTTNAKAQSFLKEKQLELFKKEMSKDIKNDVIKKLIEVFQKEKISELKNDKVIFFDSGTGRGKGVEVRLVDKDKKSLMHLIKNHKVYKNLKEYGWYINEFDNLEIGKDFHNNFGELMGCYLALIIAKENNYNKIIGDSKLVIDFWGKGICNIKSELTLYFSSLAGELYQNYDGTIEYISGDINPADLGFHKI